MLRLAGAAPPNPVVALVDSGADRSIFRKDVMETLGLGTSDVVRREVKGIGGPTETFRLRRGRLSAELAGVRGVAAFPLAGEFSEKLKVNVLGRSDFFRVFRIAFFEDAQTLHLLDRRQTLKISVSARP
ncbi:MAG: aspartyl protease family protein [Solirubrobacterales bacterium]